MSHSSAATSASLAHAFARHTAAYSRALPEVGRMLEPERPRSISLLRGASLMLRDASQ